MEDFQEADILWADDDAAAADELDDELAPAEPKQTLARARGPTETSAAAPIDISRSWTFGFRYSNRHGDHGDYDYDYDYDYDDDDGSQSDSIEIIPPHVLIARRYKDKMACSVCVGNGRTLKGLDLKRVRNSILRLTGFLERSNH
ncbi:uncharacterized protein [Typha latifolia]|uniref:uncharacterized protein n=1 Tax=Typha latifolia TaxID=4733 RepID=UPI003C2E26CE